MISEQQSYMKRCATSMGRELAHLRESEHNIATKDRHAVESEPRKFAIPEFLVTYARHLYHR